MALILMASGDEGGAPLDKSGKKEAALHSVSDAKAKINKSGKLPDNRPYQVTALFTAIEKTPSKPLGLELSIGGKQISIPKTAWADLSVTPQENNFEAIAFAGEIKLLINCSCGGKTGVATIIVREDWVQAREFSWVEADNSTGKNTSSHGTRHSQTLRFDPPQAPQQIRAIPPPASKLTIREGNNSAKPQP